MVGRTDTIAALERRAVVDALDAIVPITVVDEDGRIVYANDRWCAVSGISSGEVIGYHWTSLVHPDDLDATMATGRSGASDGGTFTIETRLVTRDGTGVMWVEVQVSPLSSEDGRPFWLLALIDVTDQRRAEEELRHSERRLEVILHHSPDVITVVDPDGTLRLTTDRLDDLFDGNRPRTVGDILSFVHPDEDRGRAVRFFFALLRNGEAVYGKLYEVRLCMPDGAIRWVETTGINLVEEPAVGGVVLISRDVTSRHEVVGELLAVSSRLAALVEHMHLGVHLSDEQGRVVAVNPAFFSTLGIKRPAAEFMEQPVGDGDLPFASLLARPEVNVPRCRRLIAARRLAADERFTLSSGRRIAVDFVPIEVGGDHRGQLWLLRDVTEETAIAAEREHLLDIERRQNARLTELDAMKSHLVSSVSHELRTPLTSIVSFTQLLRSGLGTDSEPDQREFLDVVERNTGRLLRLVDELLMLDRLESGADQTAAGKVDLARIVRQSVSSMRPAADDKGVHLVLDVPDGRALVGDFERVGQLVDNLVMNAVKFTPCGGRVSVTARLVDDAWWLEVADTGIGIPTAEQGHLFERFFRASNARRGAVPGSGLGLAIVRLVAERHGGHVEIRSAEGSGTVVTVTLRGLADDGRVLTADGDAG